MGRIRRGGYIFEWWAGDHPPRHVHVSDSNGKFIGRIAVDKLEPIEDWKPPKKVIELIRQLIVEDRL
jgi:hypothetical protein